MSSDAAMKSWADDLDALSISDSKVKSFLDDPEDSRIRAVTSGDTRYSSAKTFEELDLSPELIKGLYVDMGFERPSKVQEITLPMILNPRTGTSSHRPTTDPGALCICPTRELAIQNTEVLLKMGKHTGITSELAIPGDSANYIPVNKMAPITAQVVIGTPGTIHKWITAKKLGLTYMKILVFDEADHMLAEVSSELSIVFGNRVASKMTPRGL